MFPNENFESTPAYEALGYVGIGMAIYEAADKAIKNDFLKEHWGKRTLVSYLAIHRSHYRGHWED